MNKEYEYFARFFTVPESYHNQDFQRIMREWVDYMDAHAGEFNYLEDEDWRERRELIIAEIDRREDMRDEYEEITAAIESPEVTSNEERIHNLSCWLEFIKKYQFEYQFTDEDIHGTEKRLVIFKQAVEEARVLDERARFARLEQQKHLAALADALVEHYEKTGKHPILPVFPAKKKPRGN